MEQLRLLGVQVLHSVSIWTTGTRRHSPHEGSWIHLASRSRDTHMRKVLRDSARLRAGLARVVDHSRSHGVARRHAGMLLHAAMVRRKGCCHHFRSVVDPRRGYRRGSFRPIACACLPLHKGIRPMTNEGMAGVT